MKKPIWIQMLYTTSILAVVAGLSVPARAELVKQQAIVEDSITPEAQDEEVVIIKKKKAPAAAPVAVQAQEQQAVAIAVAQPAAPAPAATKPSMGSQLDEGIKTKMNDVQGQFEQALLKTLDRIKITVDDGAPVQGSATPTDTAVVKDSFVGTQGAVDKKDYMSVDAAPELADDDSEVAGGSSVATLDKAKSERKVRLAPILGKSVINTSSNYNIDSGMTAGIELEMDLDTNFAAVLGYSYTKYNIGLANSGAFSNYYQPYGYNNQNSTTLQYNQNLFTGGGRIYLMPRESKFRVFAGAGVGYNVGYLNYQSNTLNQNAYQYNPYQNNTTDYEVKSWLGILEGGASVNVSEAVSIGALFKYAMVFSSSENAALNNYAFTNYNGNQTADQAVVGGSLAKDSFYSILGTVKVAF